jgi:hypothetical protein
MTDSNRMDVRTSVPAPEVFMPHPGFIDEVNRNIAQSEIEGGIHLHQLSEGAVLEVETQHHLYTVVNHLSGHALISGHPNCCPEPVPVRIAGSTWGGSMQKLRYIGRGMHLEFRHPTYHTITISHVVGIRTAAGEGAPSQRF